MVGEVSWLWVLHFGGLDFWRLFPGAWTPPAENTGRKSEGKRKEGQPQADL